MGGKLKIKCPVCKKLTTWEGNPYRPFCSKECKLADLYNWFEENYRINIPFMEKEKDVKFDKKEIKEDEI